jgi:hypothetical protein
MSLNFHDGSGTIETVVYEGVMPDGLTHTIRHQDGMRLNVHDAHLCLKLQADLSNILRTPLEYCKEVGQGITKEEAEQLARPQILSPVQQELMDWHHCLNHLSVSKIFNSQKKHTFQRVYYDARICSRSVWLANLGRLTDGRGALVVNCQVPFVGRNTYSLTMASHSIRLCLLSQV